ncbi:DUF3310 domain-containing protein [Methylobacterium marchantiae]|uniref:DUF3310 domain-containing protein n=1 Tax=Methylobacterium marchantiae TaxID=600331 RepID=A0ABW3X1T0_9HYPH|nr:hypothetical protein AIGOOFII_3501 [Methylobacterium marchantiae]
MQHSESPFEPQVHGCGWCRDGRNPCYPETPSCGRNIRATQAAQSRDQEPFTHAAQEFAELGMMSVAIPELGPTDRRYNAQGVYLSPAEEELLQQQEAISLSQLDFAVMENTLTAEAFGAPVADNVNLPAHYARFKIEPMRFCIENGLNPFQFNIVKYTCREDAKNGLEDIRKVIRYAEAWHDYKMGDPDWWMPRNSPNRKVFTHGATKAA